MSVDEVVDRDRDVSESEDVKVSDSDAAAAAVVDEDGWPPLLLCCCNAWAMSLERRSPRGGWPEPVADGGGDSRVSSSKECFLAARPILAKRASDAL